jgi:hypothetical protein
LPAYPRAFSGNVRNYPAAIRRAISVYPDLPCTKIIGEPPAPVNETTAPPHPDVLVFVRRIAVRTPDVLDVSLDYYYNVVVMPGV